MLTKTGVDNILAKRSAFLPNRPFSAWRPSSYLQSRAPSLTVTQNSRGANMNGNGFDIG